MSQRTVHVILTTHWDREWVQSFEQYRFRLVNLMERLLAVLAAEPSLRFVFDGQTIVLEDYLAIRPEHRSRLCELAAEGRLVFGPWYVLADQFLEGDEATVRNLMIGRGLARDFGGAMREGYNPDSFGSIATMPMILNGFGITSSNLGRGVVTRAQPWHCFEWAWRDGSQVLALDLGYGTAMSLTWNRVWNAIAWRTPPTDMARDAADTFLAQETSRFPSSHLYASVGADHLETHPGMEAQLHALDAHTPGTRWISSTPEEFLHASATDLTAHSVALDRVIGEMRGDARAPMHLQGVLSTDIPLKQQSRRCEILLSRVLEPLEVLCRASGGSSQRHVLERAWKLLIACHPHDSICACSTDATMQDIHARLRQVEDLITISSERWLRDTVARRPQREGDQVSIMLFNPLPGRSRDPIDRLVRIPGRLDGARYRVADVSSATVGQIEVLGLRSIDIETFYATDADCLRVRSKVPAPEQAEVYTLARLRATVDFGSASGISVLSVERAPGQLPEATIEVSEQRLDNGVVGLTVAADGRLSVSDHRTGRRFTDLAYFEDMADIGDTYDYGFLVGEVPMRSYDSALVRSWIGDSSPQQATLVVETSWNLPSRLADGISRRERRAPSFRWPAAVEGSRSPHTRPLRIISEYTLHAGSDRIEVRTRFTNPCDHHRLRVGFASATQPTLSSGGHFAIIDRTWGVPGDGFPCRPLLDWIHRGDGLGILVRGLFEWEPRPLAAGGEILITLCRSTDTIGPAAGANYDVEHARALHEHAIEYALVPAATPLLTAKAALAYTTPVLAEGLVHGHGERPWALLPSRLLEISDERLLFSACKRAQADDGVVFRCWNPGADAVVARFSSDLAAHGRAVRLDELPLPPLGTHADPGAGLWFDAAPYGVTSLAIADAATANWRPRLDTQVGIAPAGAQR